MISKEEIKAKKEATKKRNKEEADKKIAAGIVLCRGCGKEFQKKELNHADVCSWVCAINSAQGYYPNDYSKNRIGISDCWTNTHRETISYEGQEHTQMSVAKFLLKEDKNSNSNIICACKYLNRSCVNWRHFKEITNIERIFLLFCKEEQKLLIEKLIIEERKLILQLLLSIDELDGKISDKITKYRDSLEHLKTIKERLDAPETNRPNYLIFG